MLINDGMIFVVNHLKLRFKFLAQELVAVATHFADDLPICGADVMLQHGGHAPLRALPGERPDKALAVAAYQSLTPAPHGFPVEAESLGQVFPREAGVVKARRKKLLLDLASADFLQQAHAEMHEKLVGHFGVYEDFKEWVRRVQTQKRLKSGHGGSYGVGDG